MKTWDAIIIGGGIIGVSLALELRRHGAEILIVDRSEPGREASFAAGGMLAGCDPGNPPALRDLALASAKLYPEFLHQLQDESHTKIDLPTNAAILLSETAEPVCQPPTFLGEAELARLEPCLNYSGRAMLLEESSLDPRALMSASLKAAKHRGIEVASGVTVTELIVNEGRVAGVRTDRTQFHAPVVVNCAGAWAGQIKPQAPPVRPVKGQMLALLTEESVLRHVIRSHEAYLIPRSDGRVVVGSTLEEAGFDKRVDPKTIQGLHQAAARLVPQLGEARMMEAWAGLRPGTPDGLPIMGRTDIGGYFLASGHYRDGILLAPVTAAVMARVIRGQAPEFDLSAFSPERFSQRKPGRPPQEDAESA